jgi:hypothetical protein
MSISGDEKLTDNQNRKSLKDSLRYAFAVDTASGELTADEVKFLEDLAMKIHRRGLTAAAIPFLEFHKPLNIVGANIVQMGEIFLTLGPVEHFLKGVLGNSYSHKLFVSTFEKRLAIECLITKLEDLAD